MLCISSTISSVLIYFFILLILIFTSTTTPQGFLALLSSFSRDDKTLCLLYLLSRYNASRHATSLLDFPSTRWNPTHKVGK